MQSNQFADTYTSADG